ncbi:MAG: GNAT family N-acetyltransferase [Gemmatimonadota bacterium]|nr:GNAT family N-acetyltransferase [Gemmatimonadota bacterium]
MATTFRLCAAADADAAAGSIGAWLSADQPGIATGGLQEGLRRFLADSRQGHLWIIEQRGLPAGYTILTVRDHGLHGEPRAYVTALYLAAEYRGQGIGRRTERFLAEVGSWLRIPVHSFNTADEQKHASALIRTPTPASAPNVSPDHRAVA